MKRDNNMENETKQEQKFTEQEIQALNVLIQAVQVANRKGSFELDESVVIGNAKNFLQKIIE
jgi:hypothetical protein